MLAEMLSSGYVLQYHLYCVALHRHLRRTLPGYDYESHFGGVFYLFLRGVDDSGSTGVFRDRPTLALINDLDNLFAGRRPYEEACRLQSCGPAFCRSFATASAQ
jgi:exodeoxyribonuclease V beta subunit